jgi:prepilin-type N-terminal cleavage/methylation domain-containing protein
MTVNRTPNHAPRRGFSLGELLVGMAIIAVLAAVLLPAVAGQVTKSDATRTIQDLSSIRTGVEQFLSDVRRYPKKLSHLTRGIAAQTDINGTAYPANLISRWKGPYVGRDTSGALGGFVTGYGAVMLDSLVKITYQPGVDYVTVRVAGITQTDFERMDTEIDGAISATGGVLRWVTGDTLKFLAVPIQ